MRCWWGREGEGLRGTVVVYGDADEGVQVGDPAGEAVDALAAARRG